MKKDIHPEYVDCEISCACGNKVQTRAVDPTMHLDICAACHPFYTGKQKLVDTAGRIEKFKRRAAKSQAAQAAAKTGS